MAKSERAKKSKPEAGGEAPEVDPEKIVAAAEEEIVANNEIRDAVNPDLHINMFIVNKVINDLKNESRKIDEQERSALDKMWFVGGLIVRMKFILYDFVWKLIKKRGRMTFDEGYKIGEKVWYPGSDKKDDKK